MALFFGRAALEFGREFLDAAGGIDQALLAGVRGMGVHRDVAEDDVVFDLADLLLAGRLHRGSGEKTFAGRDIEEANVVERGMTFGFHGEKEWDQPWRAL